MEWRAEVIIAGVPPVTDSDREAMLAVVPGVISYNGQTQDLTLTWRFSEGATITAAIERASYTWRAALGNASGIQALSPDTVCTDFRVYRALTEAEAEAQLKNIFKD